MTNNNEIKMREEFEAWYLLGYPEANFFKDGAEYLNDYTQIAWQAWQVAYRPKQVGEEMVEIIRKALAFAIQDLDLPVGTYIPCEELAKAVVTAMQSQPPVKELV